jgi:hypothetical protein
MRGSTDDKGTQRCRVVGELVNVACHQGGTVRSIKRHRPPRRCPGILALLRQFGDADLGQRIRVSSRAECPRPCPATDEAAAVTLAIAVLGVTRSVARRDRRDETAIAPDRVALDVCALRNGSASAIATGAGDRHGAGATSAQHVIGGIVR